jgi:histidinol-phosphate aminotransferase
MNLQIPRHVAGLSTYSPGKPIEELERELGLRDSIKLASNENPLGPSPRAVEAAVRAMQQANRYPDGGGFYLKRSLARKLGLPSSRILLGNGSTELVEMLARSFLGPDSNAVISEGAFVMYRIATQAAGGQLRLVPQTSDLRHDAVAMSAAVDEDTRLLFIANPNNPTGTYIREDELGLLLDRIRGDVLVVVDEAYYEYVDASDYPVTLPRLSSHPNLVILRTFSKAYGLAGIRIGYALVSEQVAGVVERIRSPFNTSSIAQAAALAALEDQEHVVRSREMNGRELPYLEDGLRRLGLKPVPSVANFILAKVGPRAEQVYPEMLKRGVIVRPMRFFGFPDSLRISVGTRPENERCLAALAEVLG